MHAAWIAFARTGDPGWPAYDLDRRATQRFDTTIEILDDPMGDERDLWAGVRWAGRLSTAVPRYWMTEPPSTARAWPTTKLAASEQSQTIAAAISSGRPSRPIGTPARIIFSIFGSPPMKPSSIGVRVLPGQTQLMRIPCAAYSSAPTRA